MENLWKKETSGTGYVAIFHTTPTDEAFFKFFDFLRLHKFQKQNEASDVLRQAGHILSIQNKLYEAIEAFTTSLRYAETGTECVRLAFTERARCFLAAQMFRECLEDREHAENANVPDVLKQKLQKDRQKRLESMPTIRRRLDFTSVKDANEHFRGIGDMVELKYNAKFGHYLVAKSDIPSNKVIVKGDAFAVGHFNELSVCYTCLQKLKNGIPCERCVYVLFCSRECMNKNQTHAYECNSFLPALRWIGDVNWNSQMIRMKLVIQTFFIALCSFSNVEKLMEFVENTLREDRDKLPTWTNDAISKYRTFFNLRRIEGRNIFSFARLAYLVTINIPKIRALFNTSERQCFLMHLILHHTYIMYRNSMAVENDIVITNLFAFMNHSCVPNATVTDEMVIETTQLVKKGDQVFVSFLSPENLQLDNARRKDLLQSQYRIDCKCDKCESGA